MTGLTQFVERLLGKTDKPTRRKTWFTKYTLLLTLATFIIVSMLWAGLAELDRVTRGQGKVVPSRQMQVVQNLEGGIVKRVAVDVGQVVNEGDLLIELDQTILRSQYNQGRQQYLAHLAKVSRLRAEVAGKEPEFPAEIVNEAPQTVAAERQLYLGRKAELAAELRILDNQVLQRRQELNEATVNLQTAERGIALAEAEMRMIKPLVEKGLEPEISLLQLQRSLNEQQGKKAAAEHAIVRLTAAIREYEDRARSITDKFRSSALSELSQATAALTEVQQSLPALQNRVTRTDVRSPVRGVVNRVLTKTVGGVVQPGEPLVEVVPLDDTLLVEAHIKPSDIAFLSPGQEVMVKITAYDFAKYGGLTGRLETISADAVKVDKDVTMYVVYVRTDSNILPGAKDQPLEIIPGMVAEVDILTGKQTVLEYLIKPVLKIQEKALRE